MNTLPDHTVPFSQSPANDSDLVEPIRRSVTALVAASLAVGLTAAVLVGGPIGWITSYALGSDCGSDGWCELGAAVFGLAAGVVAGIITYVVAGAVFIRRQWVAGQRALPAMIHIGAPVLVIGLLLALSGI